MKKLILFSILTLPLTAMAQEQNKQVSEAIVTITANRFLPIVCKKGLDEAIIAVKNCYKNTPAVYPKIEQCLIAHMYIGLATELANNTAKKNNDPIKYTDSFINMSEFTQKSETYRTTLPQYKNYNRKEFFKYIGKAAFSLIDEYSIMRQNKNNHCVE